VSAARPVAAPSPPAWLRPALILCLLAGLLRALPLLLHDPLIALANSFDEVRYSACFDLYPDRPPAIPPTDNSPWAPFAKYAFRSNDRPLCYWSSELVFTAAAALWLRVQQALGGAAVFDVRWLGALKFAALLGVWLGFCRAWSRRGAWSVALANGLLLPLVFADPANTVYLNTFYAEWSALLALYTLCGLLLLWHDAPWRGGRGATLALVALALALAKIQHLLLPLALAGVALAHGRHRERRVPWPGAAACAGAALGLAVQLVQLHRDSAAIRDIDLANRADVVFTGLLPHTRDHVVLARRLGLAPACLRYTGLRAWQLPGGPQRACPSLAEVGRAREFAALLAEPQLGLRLFAAGASALDAWLAPGLGLVEGGDFAPLPPSFVSASPLLDAWPPLRALVFAAPLLAVVAARRARWRLVSALAATTMLATLGIVVLGDGLADVPKQGHLIYNAALAWWVVAATLGARVWRARRGGSTAVDAVDLDQQFGAADVAVEQQQRHVRAEPAAQRVAHDRGVARIAQVDLDQIAAAAAERRARAGRGEQAVEVGERLGELRGDVAGMVRGVADHRGRAGNV